MAFGFGSAIDRLVVSLDADTAQFKKGFDDATKRVGQFDREVSGATGGVTRMGNALTGLRTAAVGLGGLIAAAGIGRAFVAAGRSAAAFQAEMAEVKTLLDDTSQFNRLEEAVTDLSKAFGRDVSDQIGALYSIVSSGATDAARATEILTASNRLALAGVTDVATAANGLTTILNAFGEAAGSAESAANAVFVAMRSGKLTVGDLASNIDAVASTAVGLGVSLQDVLAATSALAAGGTKTTVAMTGLRAILNGIVNPSKEAADAAERLGINLSARGLREAGGLAGMLQLIEQRTGGTAEAVSKLFPAMEALAPALALTGAQAGTFADNVRKLGGEVDALSDGVNIMNATVEQAFAQLRQHINASLRDSGSAINETLAPGVRLLVKHFDDLVLAVGSLAKALALSTAAFVAFKAAMAIGSILTAATRGLAALRIAIVALTGPIGIAITIVGGLATAFFIAGKRAREAAEEAAAAVAAFQRGIALESVTTVEMRRARLQQEQIVRLERIAALERQIATALPGRSGLEAPSTKRAREELEKLKLAEADYAQKAVAIEEELQRRRASLEEPVVIPPLTPPAGLTATADAFKGLKDQIDATFVRLDFFSAKLAQVGKRGEAGTIIGDMVGGQVFTEVRRLEDALSAVRTEIERQGGAHKANVELLTQELRIVERLAEMTPQVDLTPIRLPEVQTDPFDRKRIQAAADATQDLAVQFQAATIAGRGLIQIASSMGKLDDETRRTLDGVLGLVDAFGSFKEAARQAAESVRLVKQAADLANAGDAAGSAAASAGASAANAAAMVAKVSGIIAAIGAFVSVVQGIFAKSQAQIEREQILKKNNEVLDRLRLTMEGFIITVGATLGAGGALSQVLSTEIGRQLTELSQVSVLGIGATALADFNKMLIASGTSLRELQAFASANGIEILDSKGRLVAGAMDQLVEALELAAQEAATFSKSVGDQATLLEARVAIFGLDTDPLAEAQRAFDFMGQNLGPSIGALFDAIDVSTAEGRQAAKELVQRIFEDIEAGTAGAFGLDPALLGNFATIEEFLNWLLRGNNALDAFTDSADTAADAMKQTTDALRHVPAGFKVALARFNATAPDSTVFPFGSNVITDPGFLPPGGVGGGVTITGPVYVDARTKPVDQALAELTAEARRVKAANTGTTAHPFDIP